MTEEIHDIERLIKQSGELADSLLRLAQKLREQHQHDPRMHITKEQTKRFAALDDRLIDVRETIDPVKARQAVAKQEAAINVLQAAVAERTMTPAAAAEQLANLLDPGLPASKKIEIRQTAKTAFEAGENVVSKVRPFLKGAEEQNGQEIKQTIRKAEKNGLGFQV